MPSLPTEGEVLARTNFMLQNIKLSKKYRVFIKHVFSQISEEDLPHFEEFTKPLQEYDKNPPPETMSEKEYDDLMLSLPMGEEYCQYYGLTLKNS